MEKQVVKITAKFPVDIFEQKDASRNLQIISISGPEGSITVSDGYHTIDELYEHRIALFIRLCRTISHMTIPGFVWRSKLHHDGGGYEGWFIMGIDTEPGKQISYHLPLSKWEETEFAKTMDRAPEWDGHTPQDVLERLKNF